MSRMTRFQYYEAHPTATRKIGLREALAMLGRQMRRRMKRDGVIKPSKPLCTWAWELGDMGGTVKSNTRSEARSLIKGNLGIKSGRLPIGITITRLGAC